MLIDTKYNDKTRLFEMMNKVGGLVENTKLTIDHKNDIIKEFIDYVLKFLNITENPIINISYDKGLAREMKSFGLFEPQKKQITVVALNRNLADLLRTLAHELVHFLQFLENRLEMDSGKDGSDIENEANAKAAIIMREFGRNNPIIFE